MLTFLTYACGALGLLGALLFGLFLIGELGSAYRLGRTPETFSQQEHPRGPQRDPREPNVLDATPLRKAARAEIARRAAKPS